MKPCVLILAAIAAGVVSTSCGERRESLLRYADPFVGTAYTGHTFPGAAYPFGFMQPGPQTGNFGWEYCSGYVDDDTLMWGFTQNRLNGTGIPDLGDILMMPYSVSSREDRRSGFDKASETAWPGYYSVELTDNGVGVELTCTPHVAMHRYDYKARGRSLLLDLQSGQVSSEEQFRDRVVSADVNFEDEYTITGHHTLRGWVERQLFYVIEFDQPVAESRKVERDERILAPAYELSFADGKKPLTVKVAFSTVSVAGAKANMEAEFPHWNFDKVCGEAGDRWEEYLGRVRVEGTDEQKANFYTSMYHLLIQPNNIADVDGNYRGPDDEVHNSVGGKYYSTFSLWDTFRAAHPFYSLMYPELASDMVSSMLAHAEVQDFLPIWALWGKENYCMIGNHAVPVVVDACLRGFPGVDRERAYRAVKRSLTEPHYRGEWNVYDKYGYFPFDLIEAESVSRTLECGYDDYCAAMLAEELGYTEDRDFFMRRAGYYKNLFDPATKLARGKDSDGRWRTPFDEFHLSHAGTSGGDYTEGNAWQYVWHVPHDVEGLIGLMGGREAFTAKLDSLFTLEVRADATGFVGDVTGLIGQYAHGNEPSHHVAYLYGMAGRGDRTAEIVREIFDKFYQPRPDGLCGNDDCGQMSAWYIFSAMGFYPVDTVSGEYVIGAPQIPEVALALPNGRNFTVRAEGLSEINKYVASATLDGEPLGTTISVDRILQGGTLVFTMTDTPVIL